MSQSQSQSQSIDLSTFAAASLANKGWAFGPSFLGPGLDHFLMGVICCQFLYWKLRLEKSERWPVKLLIYWCMVACTGQTAYVTAYGMSVFVYGYGDPLALVSGYWVKGCCIFELLIALPIEFFYAKRAYNLWGRPGWLKASLVALFVACIGLGLTAIITGAPDPVSVITKPAFIAWGCSLFTIDWFLTILIVVALVRSRTGFAHSDKVLRRIILMSAEAQLIPSLVTMGILLNSLIAPQNLMVLFFGWVPKAWFITCMIVINARKGLRQDMEQERQRRQNTLNFVTSHPSADAEHISTVSDMRLSIISTPPTRHGISAMPLSLTVSDVEKGGFVSPSSHANPALTVGTIATIPELELAFVADLPDRSERTRRYAPPLSQQDAGATSVGTLSFEEMLRSGPYGGASAYR